MKKEKVRKIKFGIIGCGSIGRRHAELINKIGELKAVCDIKKDRAHEFSEKYKSAFYTDLESLLSNENEIDLISICTPNGLHAEHSIKSLRNNFNVLCEKPMALTVGDCKLMIEESEKSNKRLFIVKQNRFNPPVETLKKIIDEGRIGKILSIQVNCFWNRGKDYYTQSDWKGTKKLDGGILFTQFSHFIDIMHWLAGDVVNVSAIGKNYNHKDTIEFEDTGSAILEFENGAIGTLSFTINSYKKNLEGSVTVFGEKGTVKVGGQYLNTLEYQNIEGYQAEEIKMTNEANNYGTYFGSMSNHDKVYENVIEVLNFGGSIKTNGNDGLKTVDIINKIYNNMKVIE